MKREHWYLILGFVSCALIFWFIHKPKADNLYKDKIKKLDSIVLDLKVEIKRLETQTIKDSLLYEKEIKHIQELRNRYPNDAILDSLFKSGQRLRDGSQR